MRLALVLLAASCGHDTVADDLGADDMSAATDLGPDLEVAITCSAAPPVACNCPPQAPDRVCLFGSLYDFIGNRPITPTGPIRVSAIEPLHFFGGALGPALGCSLPSLTGTGCWVIPDLQVPPGHLITLMAGDDEWIPDGQRDYIRAARDVEVTPGESYRADVYLVPKALMAQWMSSADQDYVRNGAVVLEFLSSPAPAATDQHLGDTSYAPGVEVQDPFIRYLSARDTVGSTSLFSTQASAGAAIMISPGGLPSYGGSVDGGLSCGMPQIANSLPNIVFFAQFHCD